jgi:hypothetical protein
MDTGASREHVLVHGGSAREHTGRCYRRCTGSGVELVLRLGTALEEGLGAAACSPLGGEVGGFVRELDYALVGGLVGPLVGTEVGDYSDDSTVGCSEDWSVHYLVGNKLGLLLGEALGSTLEDALAGKPRGLALGESTTLQSCTSIAPLRYPGVYIVDHKLASRLIQAFSRRSYTFQSLAPVGSRTSCTVLGFYVSSLLFAQRKKATRKLTRLELRSRIFIESS